MDPVSRSHLGVPSYSSLLNLVVRMFSEVAPLSVTLCWVRFFFFGAIDQPRDGSMHGVW
jgi:hypothetical protein